MLDRIMRAIRLDPTLYREVAANESLTGESAIIVLVVALIGSAGQLIAGAGVGAYLLSVLVFIAIGWLLWAAAAYFVGNAMGGRSSVPEMARTLGYASAPRLLGLFSFIPCVGWILVFIGWILSLAAAVIGIRESMEFDTSKAIVTAVVGWLIYIVIAGIVSGGVALLSGALS